MKRMLIFHPALAPYRVDQFNELAKLYDLEVVFLFDNLWNHKFDQQELTSQLICKYSYLSSGFSWKGRAFRFGVLSKVRTSNPDIIVGSELSIVTWQVLAIKILTQSHATIGTMIDGNVLMLQNEGFIRRLMVKVALKNFHFVVVLSKQVQEYFHEIYGVDNERVVIAPIHQSEKRLKRNKKSLCSYADRYSIQYGLRGKKVVLFVGRLVAVKNIQPFIEAIEEVLKVNSDLVFVVVGDGDERSHIERCIHRLDLHTQVKLVGRYEGDCLYAWFMCASGFILPSVFEPFGAVIDEALCFGVPCFCSERAGSAGLITDARGICFDPVSKLEMVSAFNRFVQVLVPFDSLFYERENLLREDVYQGVVDEWQKLNRMERGL